MDTKMMRRHDDDSNGNYSNESEKNQDCRHANANINGQTNKKSAIDDLRDVE